MIIAALITKDKIFHYPDCSYVERIKPSNAIYFSNKDDARACGYRHCSHCSRIIKYYKEDKRSIDSYIASHSLKMYIDDDCMFIENTFSAWKITTKSDKYGLILYHANTESYNKLEVKDGHLIHHYHLQKYRGKPNILEMLKYIVDHDEWKAKDLDSYKSMPRTTKRQRKAYNKAAKEVNKVKTRNLCNLIDKINIENSKG